MQKVHDPEIPAPHVPRTNSSGGRSLLAAMICLSAAVYTVAVILGVIPQQQRIDATNLMILGLTAFLAILLVKPDAFEHLRRFKFAGFELELERIKQSQEAQKSQLEAISLLLPLVLQEAETQHLRNLEASNTAAYEGHHALRTELRRLATLGLVERVEGKRVRDLKDKLNFDLANYVRLTPFGKRMVQQLEEIEKAKLDQSI